MIKFFGLFTFLLALFFSETVFGSEVQIQKFCKKNFGKKFTEFNQCVLSQKSAKKFISRSKATDTIKSFCKKNHKGNWLKQKYCVSSQASAKTEVEKSKTKPLVKDHCKKKHEENWVSQRECVRSAIESE